MTSINRVQQILHAIHILLPHIPDATLLIYGPPAYPLDHAGTSDSDPGILPHRLDQVTDDWETGQPRTADGIRTILWDVADDWADHLHLTPPPPTHPALPTWMHDIAPQAHERVDPDTWTASVETIQQARTHTYRLTGRTPYRTDLTCPHCGTRMTRPATRDGITELLHCRDHGGMTPVEYLTAVRATTTDPTLIPDTWPVTTQEAATILDIPYHTADYRRRTRNIKPVKRGRNIRYPLHAFYPLQNAA